MPTHFLFVDESGIDREESPYEVLAGVSVDVRDLWNLVQTIQDAEARNFGGRYSGGTHELKGKKLLKRKTFRLAQALPPMDDSTRRRCARECLENPERVGRNQLAGLGQAKLQYVRDLLDVCAGFRCRVFASMVARNAPRPTNPDVLRKDYSYLFERFYYFLEDSGPDTMGVVVFDELEKSRSHVLLDQMTRYFLQTANGRLRASRIVPEPFFVHSDLTSGVQIADIAAYLLNWGFRTPQMTEPAREELAAMVEAISAMRYRAVRERGDNPTFSIWSVAVIQDLRGAGERRDV